MATSPIYNWPEPDNTDLVKNGALAMRTLGDAIDTTMATMVPKSIVDAKGDLIAATADNTPSRLAVGANNTVLTADSSTATGLKWATPSSSSFVGSMCYNASNVSIPNTTYTQITWGNETFDAGNIHAASSAVFVTNATGYWLIHGVIQWDTGAGGFCQIYVNRKSGATNTTMAGTTRFDSSSYIPLPFSLVVSCTSGDELSVYGYQNSGAARNIQGGGENKTYISVSYLGA